MTYQPADNMLETYFPYPPYMALQILYIPALVSQPSVLRNSSPFVFYWIWISDLSFLRPLAIIFLILPEPTKLEVLLTFSSPLIFSSPSQYSSQINLDPWGLQNVSFTVTVFFFLSSLLVVSKVAVEYSRSVAFLRQIKGHLFPGALT